MAPNAPNAAEVWNVFVTALSGAAVVYLGWQANKLGNAANAIEQGAQSRAEDAERREGRVLLITLQPEIEDALAKAQTLYDKESHDIAPTFYAGDYGFRVALLDAVYAMRLSTTEAHMQRLHVLGSPVADSVGKAIGLHRRAMREATRGTTDEGSSRLTTDEREEIHLAITRCLVGMIEHLTIAANAARRALQ